MALFSTTHHHRAGLHLGSRFHLTQMARHSHHDAHHWAATGKPHYVSVEGSIPYVSDVMDVLKPLFVVGCSIIGVRFFLCLDIERRLRYNGR